MRDGRHFCSIDCVGTGGLSRRFAGLLYAFACSFSCVVERSARA
jgi:hypothetical protein